MPFFWSAHYQTTITYVGRAERWDEILIDGSVDDGDCLVGYKLGGKILAVAAVGRDGKVSRQRQQWNGWTGMR